MGEKYDTTFINLFAGPGAGKSTTAAGLFALMKKAGESVELVTEHAKDMVYEEHSYSFSNQMAFLAEQDKRQHRLIGKVRYVVTDSPLLLSDIYADPTSRHGSATFGNTVRWLFRGYRNLNFLLERPLSGIYQSEGRLQATLSEAQQADFKIGSYLRHHGFGYIHIRVDSTTESRIWKNIKEHPNGAD